MIDAVNPPGVWSPFGAFSKTVLQGDDQIVHVKGQVSLDQSGRIAWVRIDIGKDVFQDPAHTEEVLARRA